MQLIFLRIRIVKEIHPDFIIDDSGQLLNIGGVKLNAVGFQGAHIDDSNVRIPYGVGIEGLSVGTAPEAIDNFFRHSRYLHSL